MESAYSLCDITSVSSYPCRLFLCVALLLLTGCPRGEQVKPQAAGEAPRASVALRVLVVNEPDLAEAINRLRGEWAERSGGELNATSMTWAQVASATSLDADVVIFPSRYLGELCTRGWLRTVRQSTLASSQFDAADIFPLIRRELMKWGSEVMALPLGVRIASQTTSSDDHPGLRLLAAAAPAASSDWREGALFDPQTMKPRIDEPAFVEALQKIVEIGSEQSGIGIKFAVSVPVFGFDDRLISVSTSCRNGASAFKLIAWLASGETSTQLARTGKAMVPVRRSLVASGAWYDLKQNSGTQAELGETLAVALSGEKCLLVPRIPGVDEYMAALDTAVKSAVVDKVPPILALQKAAERWEQITNTQAPDKQRLAYWKHLGISE